MADGAQNEAKFKLSLDSGQMNGSAASAADHLKRLEKTIVGDTKVLREMQAAMKQLQGAASVDIATFRNLQGRIDAMKNRVASARAEFVNLGGRFGQMRKPLQDGANAFRRFGEAAGSMGGPLGQSVGRLRALAGVVGAGGPITIGLAAIAAGSLLAAAAVAALTAGLIKYGFAAADAHRDEKLRLEGLTKMRFIWREMATGQRRAAESAEFLQQQIDRVSDKVALGRPEIEKWEARLYKLGLRGGNLQHALEGVSMAASTVGDSQAEMYLGLMMGAAQTGKSVKGVADDIRARLGPLAEKQMLSWSVQSKKLKENLQRLFTGIGIENLLRPMKMFTEMFSQNEAIGRVLKDLFSRMFKPLEESMPAVALLAKRFVQGLVIGALKIENAWLRLSIGLIDMLGPKLYKRLTSFGEGFDIMTGAVYAGGLAVSIMVAPTAALGAALFGVGIGAKFAFETLVDLTAKLAEITNQVKAGEPKWLTAGKMLARGFVNGIFGGIPAAIQAAIKLGGSALDALASKLKLGSPSRATFQFGAWTGDGMIGGVRSKVGQVKAAVQHMIDLPKRAAASFDAPSIEVEAPEFRPSPVRQQRQAPSIRIDQLTVQAPQGSNPGDFANAVKQALINELEGLAIEMGAAA